jgi:integrase
VADIFTMPRRKPDRRTRVALRVEEWPKEDRSRWEAAFVRGDVFDGAGAGAHLSAASRTGMVYAYGRWIAFLSRSDPDSLSHLLEDRVTRERVVTFCELLAETNSAVSIASALSQLRQALRLLAPKADWSWLHTIEKRIKFKALPRPKRPRQQEAYKLQALGRKLMDQAHAEAEASGSVSSRSALSFRDGLMISILVFVCPRRRNIAGLTLGRTLFRTGTAWHIRFEENETKNKRPSDVPLPPELTPYIETYLTRFRSVFRSSSEHCGVWASVKGTPLTGEAIYDAVCRRTEVEFGQSMNLHLFRDAAATALAVHIPEHARAAADLLGHSSFGPTQKHYIRAQGIAAARLLARTIRKKASV